MRILITGCSGFIGSHVWHLLEQRGHQLVGIDAYMSQVHGQGARTDDPRIWQTTVGSACAQITAAHPDLWTVDAVIHLAAEVGVAQSEYEPARYVRSNVMETAELWERIIEARSRIRKVVVASSMSIYGEGEYWWRQTEATRLLSGGLVRQVTRGWDAFDWTDGDYATAIEPGALTPAPTREVKPPEAASVYAQSKLDTERYSVLLGHAYNIPTVALRFFNVIGEGQALSNPYTGVAIGFACRVLNGRAPLVYEDGQQSRDFVHVSDVAAAVVAAVETEDFNGVYNVATGTPTSVGDLATSWCRLARDMGLPSVEPEIVGQYRVGDVRHCIGDPMRLHKATGWAPQVTIDSALRRLGAWILSNHLDRDVPNDGIDRARVELEQRGLLR